MYKLYSYAIDLSLHQDSSQPLMLLNTVLFDLIYGVLGWALIRGWMLIRINTVNLGQVSSAVFLKILLHVKLEPVVTYQFHSF